MFLSLRTFKALNLVPPLVGISFPMTREELTLSAPPISCNLIFLPWHKPLIPTTRIKPRVHTTFAPPIKPVPFMFTCLILYKYLKKKNPPDSGWTSLTSAYHLASERWAATVRVLRMDRALCPITLLSMQPSILGTDPGVRRGSVTCPRSVKLGECSKISQPVWQQKMAKSDANPVWRPGY